MLTVRRAKANDVAVMSVVMIASITELCIADHQNDPVEIAGWTANKTEAGVREMLDWTGMTMFVAECDDVVAAVGAIKDHMVMLNYVDPAYRFMGVSKALLNAMEAELRARGCHTAQLVSTATALGFYRSAGWFEHAPGAPGTGYPMRKALG